MVLLPALWTRPVSGHIEMVIGRLSQPCCPEIHHIRLGCFHHDPQQWFCAAGTHEHPAFTGHRALSFINQFSQWITIGPTPATFKVRDPNVHKFLGIGLETAIQPVSQSHLLTMAESRQLKSSENAVTGEAMRGRQNVP